MMRVYMTLSEAGIPTGFYPDDVYLPAEDGERHDAIPDEAIEITPAKYEEYLAGQGQLRWNGETSRWNKIPVVEPEPQPVTVVSKAQAKLALLESELLAPVEAALSAMDGIEGQRARIEWNDRTEFHREHEFIALLAGSIGLSSAQVDALFERAAQL